MHSWRYAYLVVAICLVINLILIRLGSGSLDDFRNQQKELAASGKPATGTITHVEQSGGRQSITYEFSMGGDKHYGSADPGAADFAEMSVGQSIDIKYLPSDPDISGYHPERTAIPESPTKISAF